MQKQKSYKKIILLLLTGLLTLLSSMSVFAKDNKGSIQIFLTKGDIGTSVENVVFEQNFRIFVSCKAQVNTITIKYLTF